MKFKQKQKFKTRVPMFNLYHQRLGLLSFRTDHYNSERHLWRKQNLCLEVQHLSMTNLSMIFNEQIQKLVKSFEKSLC